jgi:hypothetical protein
MKLLRKEKMDENPTFQDFALEVGYTVAVIAAAGVVIYAGKKIGRKGRTLIQSRKLNKESA